jgi:hypothetical protein
MITITVLIKQLFRGFDKTLAALVTRILGIVDSKLGGKEKISKAREKAGASLALLNETQVKARKSEFTKLIAQADLLRDKYYRALVLRLESDRLCSFDPVIEQNGEKLYSIVVENGKAMKSGYLDQSNQLENLKKRFEPYMDLIDQNGIRNIYDNLFKAQEQFQNAWSTSAEATSSKKDLPWASDAANDLIDTLNNDLFKRIDIAADDEGEPYVTAIKMINEAIDEAHTVQRARIARNESDDITPVEDVKAKEKTDESVSKSEERETEMV